MGRPTPQQAQQRRAVIEAALRNETPIHREPHWELYRSAHGHYMIRYRELRQVLYVAVSTDGEVRDPIGFPPDGGDVQIAISVLRSAGLNWMAQRVISWPQRRRR